MRTVPSRWLLRPRAAAPRGEPEQDRTGEVRMHPPLTATPPPRTRGRTRVNGNKSVNRYDSSREVGRRAADRAATPARRSAVTEAAPADRACELDCVLRVTLRLFLARQKSPTGAHRSPCAVSRSLAELPAATGPAPPPAARMATCSTHSASIYVRTSSTMHTPCVARPRAWSVTATALTQQIPGTSHRRRVPLHAARLSLLTAIERLCGCAAEQACDCSMAS